MKTQASLTDSAEVRPISRRDLLLGGSAAATFTVVPRHVLGGPGYVPPSEKITLACIGFGTQAVREIGAILEHPEIQVVAVCDVDREGVGYLEWSKGEVRQTLRRLMDDPDWRADFDHPPGGLDVGKELVETYYAKKRAADRFKGCNTYVDFRELLEKEKDVKAVKVLTPDHTHAAVCLAALKKGLNVVVHKPLANRLLEGRVVIDAARERKIATHFLPASDGGGQQQAMEMVRKGAIGKLREIHNWSMRPVWPQFATLPADRPPVPKGFDWQLWLGPSLDRPYHPNYTHTNFRGWYEFGGGAIADMGHYSLWPIFQMLDLDAPVSVESTPSHVCGAANDVCHRIRNDYAFPMACTVRMRFAPKGERAGLDIFWYDGGIKPHAPEELMAENRELAQEGMLWVGDKGKILAGFLSENPRLIPESRMRSWLSENGAPPARPEAQPSREATWVKAFKGGPQSYGDIRLAGPICDAMNLAAVSLRLGGRRVQFDSAAAKITNIPEANRLLTREYRPGWEIL